jgi:iron complex outermembrane receptor protein
MFPEVSLSLALRADHHSVSGWLVSPRLSVVANPSSRNTIKLLYGEAFRAPSFFEIYYDDGTALVGTPDLKAERVRTIEVSVEHRLSSIMYGSLSLYQYSMRDLIEQTTVQGEAVGQHQNIGSAHARGIECELISRSPSGYTGSVSVGTQYSAGDGLYPELTNSPRTIIGLSSSLKLLEQCEVAVRARYETGRITLIGTKTDPFLLVNAIFHVYRMGGMCDLSLAVRNVFDARYAYPGGLEHTQSSLTQDGRSFDLRAVVRW